MMQCNMAAQTMAHNDPQAKRQKEIEGVGRAERIGPTKT